MKKIIFFIVTVFVILLASSTFSYAVMGKDASAETLINTIVQERYKAEEEYHIYKAQKDAVAAQAVAAPVKAMNADKAIPPKTGRDIVIGVVLILVAIILTFRLYQISKQKQEA